jgi:hypothetical protein
VLAENQQIDKTDMFVLRRRQRKKTTHSYSMIMVKVNLLGGLGGFYTWPCRVVEGLAVSTLFFWGSIAPVLRKVLRQLERKA